MEERETSADFCSKQAGSTGAREEEMEWFENCRFTMFAVGLSLSFTSHLATPQETM